MNLDSRMISSKNCRDVTSMIWLVCWVFGLMVCGVGWVPRSLRLLAEIITYKKVSGSPKSPSLPGRRGVVSSSVQGQERRSVVSSFVQGQERRGEASCRRSVFSAAAGAGYHGAGIAI
jgi:hypothetical protein